jgi:hypothetical protein
VRGGEPLDSLFRQIGEGSGKEIRLKKLELRPILIVALAAALAAGGLFYVMRGASDAADGTLSYRVHLVFNTSVQQGDIDAIAAYLHRFDAGADVAILESFPLQASAILSTAAEGFCNTVVAELEGTTYIDGVACNQYAGPADGSPDGPVSSRRTGSKRPTVAAHQRSGPVKKSHIASTASTAVNPSSHLP